MYYARESEEGKIYYEDNDNDTESIALDDEDEEEESYENKRYIPKKYGIVCYFRKQDERTSENIWNRLASMRTGSNLIHSEFYFARHKKTLSVDSTHPVYMQKGPTKYTNTEKWEGVVIWVTKAEYKGTYKYCKLRLGNQFDSKGIYFFDFRECCTGGIDTWVCSRLMASALVHAGVFSATVNPMSVTPAILRRMLNEKEMQEKYCIEEYDILDVVDE